MHRLICDADHRLGRNGAHELKAHPFFKGIDWQNIRHFRAPFIPELKSITDTSYFPMEDLKNIPLCISTIRTCDWFFTFCSNFFLSLDSDLNSIGRQRDLAFIGYTYKRFDFLTKKNAI
jgi:protein-serine/threonine kinase